MAIFALRRFAQAVPTIFLSSVVVFLLLRLIPGDPALLLAGADAAPATIEATRREMGLDQPLPTQYAIWLSRVVQGDLGRSFISKRPVAELIGQRLPATLELAIAGMTLALCLALPLGVVAAVNRGGFRDWLISALSALALATPNFWFGILAILAFSVALGWLPPGGRVDPIENVLLGIKTLLLPAATLAINQLAILSRFVRASMLEVMQEDFTRTARAKGLAEGVVIRRHVLRNALVPIATVIGIEFGKLLGGAIIVESIFAWPGVGQLVVQAISSRDYTVLQGTLLFLVFVFVLVNLATDLIYGLLDPRIRHSPAGPG